ncbi:hypothetical protein P4H27_25755 [Paenibacillus taichungensis]|uniref:hypothetical protein n=1 Tax=Paenibacillus taichungensis TaxID=484184 RepID=UPI002DBFABA7|nr:hypothetical protein [Paenibacillus taichungensis]MEC0110379.1 hypothetical protein [Paenibacillus taichungensis]MEC0200055.1 hypothetical protein [Paenibacillus taichungensis]
MKDAAFYYVLGYFDALSYILLCLQLYMLPIKDNIKKIAIYALFITSFSFMMRMVFKLPEFDLGLQYVFLVLFLRYALEIKTHISAYVSGVGMLTYISFQLLLYFIYSISGIVPIDVINHNTGAAVWLIQVPSILIGFALTGILALLHRGFTFIVAPPHDFLIKENYSESENRVMILGAVISFVTMALTVTLLYIANPLWLAITASIGLIISIYLSIRSDRQDAIKNVNNYRSKHK